MKKRILIVEDERIVAEDISQCLEARGYEVVGIAKNGALALELAEKAKPDLALMDMVIQGDMDGVDTALALKDRLGLSVVFLTAYSQPNVLERAKTCEPLGYLVKPFEESSLLSTVELALHKASIERQMADRREWFFTTLSAVNDGLIATDETGKIVMINPSAERLTQWTSFEAQEAKLEEVFEINDPRTGANLENPTTIVLRHPEHESVIGSADLSPRSGASLPIEYSSSAIKSAEGKLLGAVLVFRDVSSQKDRERQSLEYQSHLENLVEERTHALRRRMDLEALVSSICVDLTQLGPADLEQGIRSSLQRVVTMLKFADARIVESPDRALLTNQTPDEVQEEAQTALSRLFWGGDTWYERQVSDQGYLHIGKDSPLPGKFGTAVSTIKSCLGPSVLALPLGPTNEPWAFLAFVSGEAERCFVDDVRILQVLAEVINNVLQRRRSEEERLRLTESLNQAQKLEAIGKLSGGIAHDFNNMLVPIIGYSDVILQEGGGEKNRPEILEIRKAAESAAALTRQLLAFSRKQILSKRPLNVGQVVRTMRNMLQRLLGEDIDLLLRIEPSLWSVEADNSQLEQVIMNLAVNARDAMPKGGAITIAAENLHLKRSSLDRAEGNFVRLTFRDTGLGMAAEVRDRIFEPFFTTKGQDGTGLGLSVVLGIVEQHGGSIRVDTMPGKGSTFTIDLPSSGQPCEEARAPQEASTRLYAQNGFESVLLVEDEPSVLAFVRHALSSAGFQVVTANNARSAMHTFNEHKGAFDIIFTDAVLPDGNGMEVIDNILALKPDIKVLLSSGYTDARALLDRALAKNVAFLHKPYSLAQLYEKLREVMSQPSFATEQESTTQQLALISR